MTGPHNSKQRRAYGQPPDDPESDDRQRPSGKRQQQRPAARRQQRTGPKPPRKADPAYLQRAAMFYLERYNATTASLRRILMRRVNRSLSHHTSHQEGDREALEEAVTKIVADCVTRGFVNDAAFAFGRASRLLRQGQSPAMVRLKLKQAGIAENLADDALERLREELDEGENLAFNAALAFARKRRLGPYRTRPVEGDADAQRNKDLGAFARRGFSFDLAQHILSLSADELPDGGPV